MKREHWKRSLLTAGIAAVLLTAPAAAQRVQDADWPCIQRKVPKLSVGQMWSGAMPPEDAARDSEVAALARRLSARRVPVEEIASEASSWAGGLDAERRELALATLFAAILDRINAERSQIVDGIARYARSQAALAERIEEEQRVLAELEQVPDPEKDWDRIEELRDTLAWEARVFKDRAQSLSFVCETPVLLEQRAFEIARALASLDQ